MQGNSVFVWCLCVLWTVYDIRWEQTTDTARLGSSQNNDPDRTRGSALSAETGLRLVCESA